MASSLYRDTSDSDSRGLNDSQVSLHSEIPPVYQQDLLIDTSAIQSSLGYTIVMTDLFIWNVAKFVAKWQVDSACKATFLHLFASLADWIREALGQSSYSGCWRIWCTVRGLQPVSSRRKFLKKGHSLPCKLYKRWVYITYVMTLDTLLLFKSFDKYVFDTM